MNTQQSFLDNNEESKNLSLGFPKKLAILDCETTGGNPTYHRIIEIGLLIVEDGVITKRWQTFINPETSLPPMITRLTGIEARDLNGAPLFEDISDELLELLDDSVLVAHNARFDYGFLKNEFNRIGHMFSSKLLCSVKFSRALYPQFKSHSLDSIIKRFHFSIENRHRAMDDALMVYKLFHKTTHLFDDEEIQAACNDLLKSPTLPTKLDPSEIEKLPQSPGVYYFYDDRNVLLYIGKSINIRSRVLNHFSQDYRNHKDLKMSAKIAHIDFNKTPSDFGARLLEGQEIKKLMPIMNTRLKKTKKLYRIELESSNKGYVTPKIVTVNTDGIEQQAAEQFGLFRSPRQIKAKLEKLADQFFLCHRLLGLEGTIRSSNEPCFRFQLKRCLGACCGQETKDAYNERVISSLKEYQHKTWQWNGPILVVEHSCAKDKVKHYHLIDNWVYIAKLSIPEDVFDYGYSFVDASQAAQSINDVQASDYMPSATSTNRQFELDTYFVLIKFLYTAEQRKLNGLEVVELINSG